MKYSEFSGQSHGELRKKKKDLRAQVFEAKMKNAMGQLQSPASIKNMKRDIAKIFTVLNAPKTSAPVKAKTIKAKKK